MQVSHGAIWSPCSNVVLDLCHLHTPFQGRKHVTDPVGLRKMQPHLDKGSPLSKGMHLSWQQ